MPSQTTDHNIPFAIGTDAANTIDDTMQDLAERVDQLIVAHDDGSLAARPTSTPESPGIERRVYRVNSGAAVGMVNYDTGTGWVTLRDPDPGLLASRPAANTVPAGTHYHATDTSEYAVSDGTAWQFLSAPGMLTDPTTAQKLSLIKFTDSPTLGTGGANGGFDLGVKFPTAAVHVWATVRWFSDVGHTVPTPNDGAWVAYRPGTGGNLNRVFLEYAASPARYLYPVATVYALGY